MNLLPVAHEGFHECRADLAAKQSAGLQKRSNGERIDGIHRPNHKGQQRGQGKRLTEGLENLGLTACRLPITPVPEGLSSQRRLRPPADGMVGQRQVRPGQFVNVGTQLITVVPLPNVWVIGNFKETQMTNVRVGQAVRVTVDAFPDVTLEGRVETWSPGTGSIFALLPPDNATGNFTKVVQRVPVKIILEKKARRSAASSDRECQWWQPSIPKRGRAAPRTGLCHDLSYPSNLRHWVRPARDAL